MDALPQTPFLARDAQLHGLSKKRVAGLVSMGLLHRPVRGVLVATEIPDSVELRAACLSLVVPPHVVVTDRTAAWLHGVDAFDWADLEVVPTLEVASVRGTTATRRAGVLGGTRDLRSDEMMTVHGVRVTTPVRTACDLGCLRGRAAALAVLDAFMRHHAVSKADYRRTLRRFAGRRGVKQLRELVEHATPDAESPGESWVRMLVIDAGLPHPRPNAWFHVPGHGWLRLDLCYPHLRIAIEYDGEEFHSETADREHDEARRDALRRAGWLVIVVTRHELSGAALEAWLTELRRAIDVRRPVARRRYSRGLSWSQPVRYRAFTTR